LKQKRLHHFAANLLRKICTKFCQNCQNFVEDITKQHFSLYFSNTYTNYINYVETVRLATNVESWRQCETYDALRTWRNAVLANRWDAGLDDVVGGSDRQLPGRRVDRTAE